MFQLYVKPSSDYRENMYIQDLPGFPPPPPID